MKVQVTSKPALRLMGERQTFLNRWRRFKLEFPIPSDYNTDSVTATFEGGKLTVKFAKLNKPKETTTNPPEEAPRRKEQTTTTNPPEEARRPKEPTTTTTNPREEAPRPEEPSQKVDEQKGVQEGTPKATEEKAETKTDDVSDQNTPPQMEAAKIDKVAEKVTTDGSTETTDAATSVAPKTKGAKFVARTKTRFIDFSLSKALSNQDENEAVGVSTAGLNKWKKLVAWIMLIFLVVGVGLYCRNAFRSSQEEWNNFEELLLSPY